MITPDQIQAPKASERRGIGRMMIAAGLVLATPMVRPTLAYGDSPRVSPLKGTRKVATVEVLHVNGGLDATTVDHALERVRYKFESCYEQGLRRNANLSGNVWTRFTIDRRGSVVRVEPWIPREHVPPTISDQKTVNCVFRALYQVQFPAPPRGKVECEIRVVLSSKHFEERGD